MKQILKLKRNQKSWHKRDNHRIIIYDIRGNKKKWYDIISRDGLLPNASLKKKSWTSFISSKYIKILNKVSLQYYQHIFRSSLGYEIFKGKRVLWYAPDFLTFFRRHERGILCGRISCNQSWNLYSISCISAGTFPKFVNIYSNSFIYNYIVFLQKTKKKWYVRNSLVCYLWSIYHQLFDGIYYELVKAIYYNGVGILYQVFDGIFDGTNIIQMNSII